MKNSLVFIVALVVLFSCSKPTPRRPVIHHSSSVLESSVEINRKINDFEAKMIQQYIQKDSLNEYSASADGFWYHFLVRNEKGKTILAPGVKVEFEYEISNLSNKVLYSYQELGKRTYIIDKEHIILGLQKGIKMLQEGDEIQFIFPSFHAYGKLGDGSKIGINQPLIYKVKLLKINI